MYFLKFCWLPVLAVFFFSRALALVQEDRVSALFQVVHAGWKTPWLEMGLNEMPRFMLNEVVLVHPILPKKNENDRMHFWNPEMDVKISFAFSESKVSAPVIALYSKDGRILEKVVFTFEHDAYDIISLTHTETYKDVDPESLPDLSMHQHPPIEVEYDWVSVQEEDLNLGVKVMFTMTIVLALAMAWIILMTQDSSENIYDSKPSRKNTGPTSGVGRSSTAGITVNKRR